MGPAAWFVLGSMALALIAASAFFFVRFSGLPGRIAASRDWLPAGAPCVEVSKAAFDAQPVKVKYVMDYGPMRLGRSTGHAECTDIADDGGRGWGTFPVCRFMSPTVLDIQVDGQDHYFLTGLGAGATVSLPKGRLTCVVGHTDAFGKDPRGVL